MSQDGYRVYRNGSYYNTDNRGAEMLRQAVNSGYQQDFQRGYQDGYNSRNHYGNGGSLLGNILGSILNIQNY